MPADRPKTLQAQLRRLGRQPGPVSIRGDGEAPFRGETNRSIFLVRVRVPGRARDPLPPNRPGETMDTTCISPEYEHEEDGIC